MNLTNEQKKDVLKLAIEMLPQEEFMCIAISLAAVRLGITKLFHRNCFDFIPELIEYKPLNKRLGGSWFEFDNQLRINILTEILNKL